MTVSVNFPQNDGGGGGGGSGTINNVIAGAGLIGGGSSGAVTLSETTGLTGAAGNSPSVIIQTQANGSAVTPTVAATTTATGTSGTPVITVASATGIAVGQYVQGTGIGTGAIVKSIVSTVVTLTQNNSAAVSGSVTFTVPSSIAFATTGTNVYTVWNNGVPTTLTIGTAPTASTSTTLTRNINGAGAQTRVISLDATSKVTSDTGWA